MHMWTLLWNGPFLMGHHKTIINLVGWGGGGGLLYLSDNHYFKLKMGLRKGTNNFVEIMSLKLLLLYVGKKVLNHYKYLETQ
jgi:hypothetical protein